MKHRSHVGSRLAMAGPMVLFVGIFVVCCGILTCVFLRSAQLSREAEQYNAAVVLCRSQAERLRSGETPEARACFDGSLTRCEPGEAAFLMLADRQDRDGCSVWTLTVCTPEEAPIYSLEIYTDGEADA